MVYRIAWTRKALKDLRQIHDYIAQDSRRYARIQVERIQGSALKIAKFPEVGRILPEFPSGPWREVLTGNYRLIYRLEPSGPRILVVAVVHGRQLLHGMMLDPE